MSHARRIDLSQRHKARPDRVWALVTSLDALAKVNAPLLTMSPAPEGRIAEGDVIETVPRMFGLFPLGPYRMEVVTCDPEAMTFESRETGAGVDRFEHRLTLVPDADGTLVRESITVAAGFRTGAVAAWARMLYRHRHKRRAALLLADAVEGRAA